MREKARLQFVPLYHLVLVKINDDANLAPFERRTVVMVAVVVLVVMVAVAKQRRNKRERERERDSEKGKNKTRDKIKTIIGSFSQFGATKGIN